MSGVRLPDRVIFVSHSAKEGEARSLLDRLSAAISDADFHPFISDLEIERGDPYKEVLEDRLRNCHGAILLLSPSALTSDWVYDEAHLLIQRHKQEKEQFLLLPFLIAGATRDALKESRLDRLGISDLHSPRTEMTDIIGEIIATLKRFFAQSPWYQLEAVIVNRLRQVSDDVLMLVADELEMDTARWHPRGWQHAIAAQLMRTDRAHFSRAMTKIIKVIDDPLEFIEMIFPFTWIDGQAVVPLTETATSPPPRAPLAVNSERTRTGCWYVRRACPDPEPWSVEQAWERDQSFGTTGWPKRSAS